MLKGDIMQQPLFDAGPPTHRPKIQRMRVLRVEVRREDEYEVDLPGLIQKYQKEWEFVLRRCTNGEDGYKPEDAPAVFLDDVMGEWSADGGGHLFADEDQKHYLIRDLYGDMMEVDFTIRRDDRGALMKALRQEDVEYEQIPEAVIEPPIPIKRRRRKAS